MPEKEIMSRDKIVNYLDKQYSKYKQTGSVPEHDNTWEYVAYDDQLKIVDGLIPMVKKFLKEDKNERNK